MWRIKCETSRNPFLPCFSRTANFLDSPEVLGVKCSGALLRRGSMKHELWLIKTVQKVHKQNHHNLAKKYFMNDFFKGLMSGPMAQSIMDMKQQLKTGASESGGFRVQGAWVAHENYWKEEWWYWQLNIFERPKFVFI